MCNSICLFMLSMSFGYLDVCSKAAINFKVGLLHDSVGDLEIIFFNRGQCLQGRISVPLCIFLDFY